MSGISLRDLEAFALVAERRSFRAAARELGLSPSALSYIVSMLEANTGVQLLHRTTRNVSPTEAGEQFLARVRPALGAISDAMRFTQDHRDVPAGRIRLNASEGAAERILPDLLTFMDRYPDIAVDLVTYDRLIDIAAEGFDAGIRLQEAVPQDMVALPLWRRAALILVASPSYLERNGTPTKPADLSGHACVRSNYAANRPLEWEFVKDGRPQRAKLSSRLLVGNVALARLAALGGAGIAYVSDWSVHGDLEDGRLVQVLADWTPDFEGNCLYYPRHRQQSVAFRTLIHFLRNHLSLKSPIELSEQS
ncbi:LysR family transcriptional regulator [Rhizobium leguminosarum]|uniref:LysR family transcriptional regulator n=1 Tax=Rhizobium leguminosarum TaxID=384 RepID=UPI00143F1CE2|nr:LysR family transcriptional regulator [Rhizobium leguminosarum]NKL24722.1 LysR family transcriptional regulator [Rhizobium leguminosarum bv. viciae]